MADIHSLDAARRGEQLVKTLQFREARGGDPLMPIQSTEGLQLAGQLSIAARNALNGIGEWETLRVFNAALREALKERTAKEDQRTRR